jgi:hypothetical protein
VFEQGAAGRIHRQPFVRVGHEVPTEEVFEIAPAIEEKRAGFEDSLAVPRKEVLDRRPSGLQHEMCMVRLRDTRSGDRLVR